MTPYACPIMAAVALAAFPTEAFGRRGLRSLKGVATYVGHATFAGMPGAALAWAVPGTPVEAMAGLAVAGVSVSGAILLPPLVAAGRGKGTQPRPVPPKPYGRAGLSMPSRPVVIRPMQPKVVVIDHEDIEPRDKPGFVSPWQWARAARKDGRTGRDVIVRP